MFFANGCSSEVVCTRKNLIFVYDSFIILGLKSVDDSPDLLKEAASRPIKHRLDVNSVDNAKERSVKNAINARMNRQKHKQYVQTLEEENQALKEETKELKRNNDILQEEKDILNREIVYLKKVIANDSALSTVLSGLNGLKDVRLTSSFAKCYKQVGQQATDDSIDTRLVSKIEPRQVDLESSPVNRVSGGVCLTVSGDMASIELCEKCDQMASSAT